MPWICGSELRLQWRCIPTCTMSQAHGGRLIYMQLFVLGIREYKEAEIFAGVGELIET